MESAGLDYDEEVVGLDDDIEVAVDTIEVEEFVSWLWSRGFHRAHIGSSTASYVNGIRHDLGDLWHDYCHS